MNEIQQESVFKNRVKQFFSKGIIYSIGSSLQLVVSFILIPTYTSYLTTEDYGILSLMTITSIMILTITKTPAATGFVRFFYAPDFSGKRKELLFNAIAYSLSISLVISILFLMSGRYWALVILGSEKFLNVIYIYSIIIFLQPLLDLAQDLLKMQKRAVKFCLMHFLNTLFSASLIIFLIMFYDFKYMALIWGALLSTIFPIAFLFYDIIKNIKVRIDTSLLRKVLNYGFPLILTALSLFIIEYSEQYIVKYFLGIDQVGLYSFGFKFAFIINIILVLPMQNIINALIFELEDDKENLFLFVRRISNLFFVVGIFFALCISLFSKETIMVLAQKEIFWDSWKVIPPLSLAFVFYGAIEITGKGINLVNKSKLYGILFLGAAIINLSVGIVLIQLLGIIGASFSKLVAFVVLNILLYYFSNKYYGLILNIKRIVLVIVIGIFVYFISLFVQFDDIVFSLVFKLFLVLLYIIFLYIFRIVRKDELIFFKRIISINKRQNNNLRYSSKKNH